MSDDNGSTPGVYAKLNEVMGKVGRIPKTGRNDFHGYDYATEADIVDEIRPLMSEAGLAFIPSQGAERQEVTVETKSGETTVVKILHTFRFVDTEDGSEVEVSVWGEGQDSMDKGSYKAFTGAEKYALMKTFMVATGDDPERDASREGHRTQPRDKKRGDGAGPEPGEWEDDPASEKQVGAIKGMVKGRDLTEDQESRIKEKLENGLTKGEASKAINWLKRQPKANGGAPNSEESGEDGAPSDVPGEPAAKAEVRTRLKQEVGEAWKGQLSEFGFQMDGFSANTDEWSEAMWSEVLEGLERHGMAYIQAPDEVLSGEGAA